ncbi:MAG: SusD/RagB family nutrient-binding outer membrane lipoprotein [Bacteroidota bacterium]|nr:SusD/RagB family nutrient-binding outer membrane lipoprotein [Bacteroidota bacterium]
MKKNYIPKVVLLIVLLFSVGACESDFEEINTDPNNPTEVPTAFLLSSAQQSIIQAAFGMNRTTNWDAIGMRYMQMWTSTLYTDDDRYAIREGDFTEFYKGGLTDLTEIIRLNTDEKTKATVAASGANQNQIAVARILKAWTFQIITDIWGDIPYSEALQGLANTTPAYDPQSAIYTDLIKELDEATAQIDETAGDIQGDLFYNGNMANWKLFAQSLKLRMGMRLSEVDPEKAAKTVQEALSAGVFTSNDQMATFRYMASAPYYNPFYHNYYIGTPTIAVANTLVDKMLELQDPRISAYAQEKENGGGFVGMPYGVSAAIAGSVNNKNVSFQSTRVLAADVKLVLQSYSEVLFLQAEAAARGWASGNPEELYKAAITASMQYWDVPQGQIDTYLAQPAVAYDPTNYRKSIGDQKWLSLYLQGLEAWSEWRRLDYPALLPAPDAAQGREIPRRRGYPLQEISLNKASYEAAVARQGPDVMETRVWWDK